MNAAWLLIPFILIRFLLLGLLGKSALKRAAYFPPLVGKESIAYWFYQMTTVAILVYLFFLKVIFDAPLIFIGAVMYSLGIAVCLLSTIHFAKPNENGVNLKGLYRISRNPMYVGYFLFFLGCVLLTHSPILLAILLVFQLSAHWIIRSEERWCSQRFGETYMSYMKKVRRYL